MPDRAGSPGSMPRRLRTYGRIDLRSSPIARIPFEPAGDRVLVVALLDSEAPAERVDQRVEGDRLAERDATAFLPGGPITDPLTQLIQQTGFPDARFADDEHHLTLAAPGLLEA